jgi:hypothetical protein
LIRCENLWEKNTNYIITCHHIDLMENIKVHCEMEKKEHCYAK